MKHGEPRLCAGLRALALSAARDWRADVVRVSGRSVAGRGRLRYPSQELWEQLTASPWAPASPGATPWEALLLEDRQPPAGE